MKPTKQALDQITQEALGAFWEVVVRHYPQAVSGDLSPLQTMRLEVTAEIAIKEWIANNVPS